MRHLVHITKQYVQRPDFRAKHLWMATFALSLRQRTDFREILELVDCQNLLPGKVLGPD